MESHFTNETTEAQKNPSQGHVRWNSREAEPGRVSSDSTQQRRKSRGAELSHSRLFLAPKPKFCSENHFPERG